MRTFIQRKPLYFSVSGCWILVLAWLLAELLKPPYPLIFSGVIILPLLFALTGWFYRTLRRKSMSSEASGSPNDKHQNG